MKRENDEDGKVHAQRAIREHGPFAFWHTMRTRSRSSVSNPCACTVSPAPDSSGVGGRGGQAIDLSAHSSSTSSSCRSTARAGAPRCAARGAGASTRKLASWRARSSGVTVAEGRLADVSGRSGGATAGVATAGECDVACMSGAVPPCAPVAFSMGWTARSPTSRLGSVSSGVVRASLVGLVGAAGGDEGVASLDMARSAASEAVGRRIGTRSSAERGGAARAARLGQGGRAWVRGCAADWCAKASRQQSHCLSLCPVSRRRRRGVLALTPRRCRTHGSGAPTSLHSAPASTWSAFARSTITIMARHTHRGDRENQSGSGPVHRNEANSRDRPPFSHCSHTPVPCQP